MAGDTTDGCLPSKMVPSQSSQEMEAVSQQEADHQHLDSSQAVSPQPFLPSMWEFELIQVTFWGIKMLPQKT